MFDSLHPISSLRHDDDEFTWSGGGGGGGGSMCEREGIIRGGVPCLIGAGTNEAAPIWANISHVAFYLPFPEPRNTSSSAGPTGPGGEV